MHTSTLTRYAHTHSRSFTFTCTHTRTRTHSPLQVQSPQTLCPHYKQQQRGKSASGSYTPAKTQHPCLCDFYVSKACERVFVDSNIFLLLSYSSPCLLSLPLSVILSTFFISVSLSPSSFHPPFLSLGLSSRSPSPLQASEKEKESPAELTERCFRELLGRAAYGNIKNAVTPVLM